MKTMHQKRASLILPKDYHTKWKIEAAGMDISMNEFALRALFHYFEDLALKRNTQMIDESKIKLDMFKRKS